MISTGKFLSLFILIILMVAAGCRSPSAQGKLSEGLTVYSAASLTAAFAEIGEDFETLHPEKQVRFNFAGSQQLAQQIAQGGPADVFASADEQQMEVVIDAGRVDPKMVKVFANNHLVVIYPQGNPAGINRLQDLAQPDLKVVLANQAVPAGHYAQEFLGRASQQAGFDEEFKSKVMQNVVSYEENVKAVVSKVSLGEADAGIVYTSDLSPSNADNIGWLEIPDPLNIVPSYFIAPLEDSSQPTLASQFIDFVLSSQGQDVLAQFGFIPVQ